MTINYIDDNVMCARVWFEFKTLDIWNETVTTRSEI